MVSKKVNLFFMVIIVLLLLLLSGCKKEQPLVAYQDASSTSDSNERQMQLGPVEILPDCELYDMSEQFLNDTTLSEISVNCNEKLSAASCKILFFDFLLHEIKNDRESLSMESEIVTGYYEFLIRDENISKEVFKLVLDSIVSGKVIEGYGNVNGIIFRDTSYCDDKSCYEHVKYLMAENRQDCDSINETTLRLLCYYDYSKTDYEETLAKC